jgi:hypothetical protein
MTEDEPWYAVRCVFAFDADDGVAYEERVTVWKAASFDGAIERAEQEAVGYAADVDCRYVGLAQVFRLGVRNSIEDGDEVFSLIRDSDLAPEDYLSRFFDTGTERQRD